MMSLTKKLIDDGVHVMASDNPNETIESVIIFSGIFLTFTALTMITKTVMNYVIYSISILYNYVLQTSEKK